jgi:GrpB-like predicted nucleotidyltransferase (UPF0157 family)
MSDVRKSDAKQLTQWTACLQHQKHQAPIIQVRAAELWAIWFWHPHRVVEDRRIRSLRQRLADAGVETDAEPLSAFRRLRQAEGKRATIIDLYRLVSEARGLQPHELPLEERLGLARSAMPFVWPGFGLTEGSGREDPIRVNDYDANWPTLFADWRKRISSELGDAARRIEHVGSTAVEGLAAKPIVDVQVSVIDIGDEDLYVEGLERVGVQLRSRDELHRYFRPFRGMIRNVHVHVCDSGSEWEREHLLFRDFLRTHHAARNAYAETKRVAARMWADDGWGYTDAKSEIILDLLEAAERWATASGWRA